MVLALEGVETNFVIFSSKNVLTYYTFKKPSAKFLLFRILGP